MHPFISGRPSRAAAIERLIERARSIDGLWIAAGDEIAAWVETLDLPPVTPRAPRGAGPRVAVGPWRRTGAPRATLVPKRTITRIRDAAGTPAV